MYNTSVNERRGSALNSAFTEREKMEYDVNNENHQNGGENPGVQPQNQNQQTYQQNGYNQYYGQYQHYPQYTGYRPYANTQGQYYYGNGMYTQQRSSAQQSTAKKGASKGFVIGMVAIGLLISMLFGSFVTALFYRAALKKSANGTAPSVPSGEVVIRHSGGDDQAQPVTEQGDCAYAASIARNSVVEIRTNAVSSSPIFGQYTIQGAGSGVIISSTDDGTYIITCAHVIEGAKTIEIYLTDGTQYLATYSAYDSLTDIGIVKINVSGLPTAKIADADKTTFGEKVIAIGNPLGELGGSVSSGIISSLERVIEIDGINYTLLQTDAAINPGNSGGGLFNMNGELLGIVNAKSTGSDIEGLGFAIPVDKALSIFEELVKNGYVSGRVMIGIKIADIQSTTDLYSNSSLIKYFTSYGLYISSSDVEGLKTGDRIVSFDNIEIKSYSDLRNLLLDYNVGDKVTIQVSRVTSTSGRKNNTELFNIEVTLKERVAEDSQN